MHRLRFAFLSAGILLVLAAIGMYVWRTNDIGECGWRFFSSNDAAAEYFTRRVFETTDTEMRGHPIDSGYTPEMLMQTYPRFEFADFHCVEAYQGRYFSQGKHIYFRSTAGNRVSTMERAIARIGMERLLEQAARRLRMPFSTNTDINAILLRLVGDAHDESSVPLFGIYRESSVRNGLKEYRSDLFGVSFSYPERYLLFETKGEGAEGKEYYVVTLVPDSPFIRDLMKGVPYDTEGPPSIHFSFYRERSRSVSLEAWIRANWQSNFDSSDPAQSGVLTPTAVAGIPALSYHYEGLYSVDVVAFVYGEWIVIAGVDDAACAGDHMRDDFTSTLASLSGKR